MDVDAEHPRVAGDDDRLAHPLQVRPDLLEDQRRLPREDQEDGLVTEAFLLVVGDVGQMRDGHAQRRVLDGPLDERVERSGEQERQAPTTGIDDAGVTQDLEQLRRPFDARIGGANRGLEHGHQLGRHRRRLGSRGGGLADDGQHRALDRAGDGRIGRVAATLQGACQVAAVDRGLAVDLLAHAAQDLREDHAAVAAGAHQRSQAECRADPPEAALCGWDGEGPLDGGAHRREQVRARVAVRDGEDVERVDLVDVGREMGGSALAPRPGGARPARARGIRRPGERAWRPCLAASSRVARSRARVAARANPDR